MSRCTRARLAGSQDGGRSSRHALSLSFFLQNEVNADGKRREESGGGAGEGCWDIWGLVERNGDDFLVSETSCLNHMISVILPDTFSYHLYQLCACLCGGPFSTPSPLPPRHPPDSPGAEEKQSIFLSYLVERQLSTRSLISCTLKTVCARGALLRYRGDGSNFNLPVSHRNIRET